MVSLACQLESSMNDKSTANPRRASAFEFTKEYQTLFSRKVGYWPGTDVMVDTISTRGWPEGWVRLLCLLHAQASLSLYMGVLTPGQRMTFRLCNGCPQIKMEILCKWYPTSYIRVVITRHVDLRDMAVLDGAFKECFGDYPCSP